MVTSIFHLEKERRKEQSFISKGYTKTNLLNAQHAVATNIGADMRAETVKEQESKGKDKT